MERVKNKNNAEDNAVEALPKSEPSRKNGQNSLKAKTDIEKSMAKNFLKTRQAAGISDVQRRKRKKVNQTVSEGSKEENTKELELRVENQQKDATTSKELVNREEIQKNQENKSDSLEKGGKLKDSPNKRRREEEPGVSNRNRRNGRKREGKRKKKLIEQKEKHSNSEKKNKIKEKNRGKEKQLENKKKGKIDGIIFMCNAKTKPDCFRYCLMGVSQNKKNLVLGIRPGVKLFLYDYDLKLMYGIYRASSSGGMKLEPKAFGGAFPAQVRFTVHADCFPLAESIFKKAIKENYNENNKFKTELNARQVRKLTELFRLVAVHSTSLPIRYSSRAGARIYEHPENREAHDRAREARLPSDRVARLPSDREAPARDPYAIIGARNYSDLSRERDQQIPYGKLASIQREDSCHDLYINEKEYRAYGLQRERRNLILQQSITPTLASYPRDYGELLPRQHRESVPVQRDRIHSGPHYLTEREYRTYDLGASTSVAAASTLNSYTTDYRSRYYGDSLVESYLPRPVAEAEPRETDHWKRQSNEVGKLHSTYASGALADYNRIHRPQDLRPEAAPALVSSWYSFAGAPLSYR